MQHPSPRNESRFRYVTTTSLRLARQHTKDIQPLRPLSSHYPWRAPLLTRAPARCEGSPASAASKVVPCATSGPIT